MTGRVHADDWTTCDTHEKRAYKSRKAAKIALDNSHPDDSGMRPYRCTEIDGAWHLGHLPRLVKQGIVGADTYYDPASATRRRGWSGPQGKGAARRVRAQKRGEATRRGLTTPHERTRGHRLGRCDCRRAVA
jgi:hypothetical protein